MGGCWNPAWARSLAAPFVDFLYPPVCFLCSAPLDERDAVICSACWGGFTRAEPSHPALRELEAKALASGMDALAACWIFEKESRLREAVHLLKYRRVRSIGARMGEELGRVLETSGLAAGAALVVPVPMHPARRRERGYNQSELVAEGVARVTGLGVERSLLVRRSNMPSQTMLGGRSRRANVRGAFAIDPTRAHLAAGAACVLVDDVMTTGATLAECAGLLRSAGAARIVAACAAVAG